MTNDVIAWWSGGISSAVACKIASDMFGLKNTRFIFIDTKNEDEDTYRFKKDCEKWYGKEIEVLSSDKHESIQAVWRKYKSINTATGAICSSELKKAVRTKWQKTNEWKHQVFGFDISEIRRVLGMKRNNSKTSPIFPLLMYGYEKGDCIDIVQEAGIEVPRTYHLGFLNNNCFNTGCVQGGIGYWQKIQREYPDKFDIMADMEHELTDAKGKPVTMLKDQSKGGGLVFLKPHKDYPYMKDISMMKGREPKPLLDCYGLCSADDLKIVEEAEEDGDYLF